MTWKLHLGDCLEYLRTLPSGSVDAVVTDPPYGVSLGNTKGAGGKHGLKRDSYSMHDDSYVSFVSSVVPRINASLDIAKRSAVFTGQHIHEQRKPDAIGGVYCPAACGRHCWGFKDFLPVLLYGKAINLHKGARPTVLRSTARAEKNGHPCPKPIEWMVWLVEMTCPPGGTVLDPFMGSGTTGVACIKTGRNFIGCEISPEYHAIATRRLKEAEAADGLFAGGGT